MQVWRRVKRIGGTLSRRVPPACPLPARHTSPLVTCQGDARSIARLPIRTAPPEINGRADPAHGAAHQTCRMSGYVKVPTTIRPQLIDNIKRVRASPGAFRVDVVVCPDARGSLPLAYLFSLHSRDIKSDACAGLSGPHRRSAIYFRLGFARRQVRWLARPSITGAANRKTALKGRRATSWDETTATA